MMQREMWKEERDAAMAQVAVGQGNRFGSCTDFAERWVQERPGMVFTSFDLIAAHRKQHPDTQPRDPRVWGPVVKLLQRQGRIVSTGRYLPHPSRHGAPVPEWKCAA